MLVVILEGVRKLDMVVVEIVISRMVLPASMRRFLVVHHEEAAFPVSALIDTLFRTCASLRLRLIPLVKPIDSLVSHDINGVTFLLNVVCWLISDELRIPVITLPWYD